MKLVRLAAFTVAALALVGPAHAQSVADFYKGKQMTMVIGSAAGGGYDSWARLVARHIVKHIPGNPTMIPQNMPGAGTLVATNHLYAIAPKDGTVIGGISRDAPLSPLTGTEAKFDSLKFNWLGSPTTETSVCIAHKRAGVASFADLQKKELIIGDTGPGTGTYVFPRVLNAMMGTKFKIVTGFPGSPQVILAMEKGEVDGICESLDSVMRRKAEDVKNGTIVMLFQGGAEPNPSIKNVPFLFDFAKTDEQKQALNFVYAGQGIGRPFLAPPGVPADRVKALQDAFVAMMKDPEFIAEAEKQKLDVDPVSGAKLAALIKQLYETPKPVILKVEQVLKADK